MDVTDRDYLDGVLAVYEQTDVSLLRDVFEWAYERSAARYRAVVDSLGRPDPIRLLNRDTLTLLISAWVVDGDPPSRNHCDELARRDAAIGRFRQRGCIGTSAEHH